MVLRGGLGKSLCLFSGGKILEDKINDFMTHINFNANQAINIMNALSKDWDKRVILRANH